MASENNFFRIFTQQSSMPRSIDRYFVGARIIFRVTHPQPTSDEAFSGEDDGYSNDAS